MGAPDRTVGARVAADRRWATVLVHWIRDAAAHVCPASDGYGRHAVDPSLEARTRRPWRVTVSHPIGRRTIRALSDERVLAATATTP